MNVLEFITKYHLEAIVLAIIITALTGVLKMPIKKLATKAKNSSSITRFIVFMPIILGFGLAVCYEQFLVKDLKFDKEFYLLWLSSSGLSLTIYSILEKVFPSRRKILQENEIEQNKVLIKELKDTFLGAVAEDTLPKSISEVVDTVVKVSEEKIVLNGCKRAEVKTKEEQV